MDFQLIIPCYNEAKSLEAMLSRTVEVARAHGYTPDRFQLVIVNNGSTDDSSAILQEMGKGPLVAWFKLIHVKENRGYGDGIWQGLKASSARYVGWTHADEQCDPKDAFDALRKLLESPDSQRLIVKGRRYNRKMLDFAWSRTFECIVLALLHSPIFEINAQPKVFGRELLKELPEPPVDIAFDLYVLWRARRAGWHVSTIPVIFGPRAHGQSRWAFSIRSRLKSGFRMVRYIWRLRQAEKRRA